MRNPQLLKDLATHLQQKVMEAGMDCTDAAFGINPMEAAGILVSGADVLLKLAAGLHAASRGEGDPVKAFNSHDSYTFVINSLKKASDVR